MKNLMKLRLTSLLLFLLSLLSYGKDEDKQIKNDKGTIEKGYATLARPQAGAETNKIIRAEGRIFSTESKRVSIWIPSGALKSNEPVSFRLINNLDNPFPGPVNSDGCFRVRRTF